jgi:acyl-CoA synthetase (AMP-forming)/AMP-acid ligase II
LRLESARPRIAVLCRNHRGLVETLIAGSKRGADVILLNTGYGAGQLRDVLTELRIDLMVADVEFADIVYKAPQSAQRAVVWADAPGGTGPELEDIIADAVPYKLRPPRVQGRMIMLSSGTTGRPKGARRRPRPGLRPLASMLSRIPLRAHDTMVIDAPIFHTWGFAAMQMGFAMRGTLVLHRRFAAEQTLRAIAGHRKVDLFAAPVMVQRIMDLPAETLAGYDTSALRIVAVSGSALPGDLATRFMDHFGDKLYNIYGSTEASWVSIATPRDLRTHPGAAGRPPRGTKLAILNEQGQPVPPGVRGHIYAGNELIFEGYTSGAPSDMRDGLLGTGDLGHVDRSGLLHVDGPHPRGHGGRGDRRSRRRVRAAAGCLHRPPAGLPSRRRPGAQVCTGTGRAIRRPAGRELHHEAAAQRHRQGGRPVADPAAARGRRRRRGRPRARRPGRLLTSPQGFASCEGPDLPGEGRPAPMP